MPQKVETSSTLIDALEKISGKDRAFNFDVTLELMTRSVRVGTLRVHGRIEAVASRRK